MIITVLGSAAGGGFPQINCNCRNCSGVRFGEPGLSPRTQSSVAVSADGQSWVLLNASPDLRQQIAATPQLVPRRGAALRESPIKAVVLTNADVDHIAGLLSLRESFAFTLHASERVLGTIAANSIFNVLDPELVPRISLPPGQTTELASSRANLGLTVETFPVPGKVALYLEDAAAGQSFGTREGDTVGLRIAEPASGAAFFYIPGCAAVDRALASRIRGAQLVLFDGTLFSDDEMIVQKLSAKTGKRMGHISMSGADGSIAALRDLEIGRRVFVHINNSNPALRDGSPERAEVEKAEWEVAFDGMEIRL
jgi:pyrroloquinoline quinone biosynthesis protein B